MKNVYRVGVDIGGTFTDLILLNTGGRGVWRHKLLTTPEDPARGVMAGLEEILGRAGIEFSDCESVVHGTTLVTNSIIARTGVKTALITTSGFADVLEMGREQRYDIYDLFLEYPEPLVPRDLRFEIDERISRDGESLCTPDTSQIGKIAEQLREREVEAAAICLLHSYRNPENEQMVARVLRKEAPHLSISVSSEVSPEIREYERTSTTAANAYVQPNVDRYLERLDTELAEKGFTGRLSLMQSSGGLASPDNIRRYPIRLLESGPAGGAMVGGFLAEELQLLELLHFDMGGTTAKMCLIREAKPELASEIEAARVHRFKRGSGITIKTPVVDLMEIGAGGGSIAGPDRLGLPRVGPQSAGADPGPACYGLGGGEPTVTDACLTLGYFDPDNFLGGDMRLDPEAARTSLEVLAGKLDLTTVEAAWGVYGIVCESMASAARVHVIEKGYDPRRFPLVASGGAGPAHAARVARALGSPEVIVPPNAGVASTLGFLVTPATFEFSRSFPGELRSLPWKEVSMIYAEMEGQAREALDASGVDPATIHFERSAQMRLVGQFHDIEVPVPTGELDESIAPTITEAFTGRYEELFHAVPGGYQPMILDWRLRATGPKPGISLGEFSSSANTPKQAASEVDALSADRDAYFPESGCYVKTPVYPRHLLAPGDQAQGPAIVEERESTVIVNPGDVLFIDEIGNLRIKVGEAS